MSKVRSFEDLADILIVDDTNVDKEDSSDHNDKKFSSTTRNISDLADILIDPTDFPSNNNNEEEEDDDDDNNTYEDDDYEEEFEEDFEEEDLSDDNTNKQSQSPQKESPITKSRSPIGYPTIGKKGLYDDVDNVDDNNDNDDDESIAVLDDDESVISNSIPPEYSNVKKAVKAAEDLVIEDSQGSGSNNNKSYKYNMYEEVKCDIEAAENFTSLPASIIPNNNDIKINKVSDRGTHEHPPYSRSIKNPPLHSRKVPSLPSSSSSGSGNAFVYSQIPPSNQKGRRVAAEMKAMARGTVRQGSDVKPIHPKEIPGITSYLKSKQEEEENHQDNSNINHSSSYNNSDSLDETAMGNGIAHDELRIALKQAGFSGINVNPNQLVHVLAAMMDEASKKAEQDKDFRSKLNRRSKPVPTYASEASIGLRHTSDNTGSMIDKNNNDDNGDGTDHVTKLYNKRNKITNKKKRNQGGVFGNILEEDLSQATYRGIPPYDDDYDVAIESEDIALSAVLQGAVGVEGEVLQAYASMHNRIAALEAKLRDPEGDTQRTLSNVKVSREPTMQQYVNTRAEEMSLMASRSLENLPLPPSSLKINNNLNKTSNNKTSHAGNTNNNGLLRIGSDRLDLMVKAQEIYADFLSDMCDLCKNRTGSAASVEELAMHRAIAEYVRKSFSGFGNIEKIQQEMIAAATEVSLIS